MSGEAAFAMSQVDAVKESFRFDQQLYDLFRRETSASSPAIDSAAAA